MEKNENISGYEKYSEWFKKIEKMCDETSFMDIGMDRDCSEVYKHYEIDNGLQVYIKENGKVFISDERISDFICSRHMKKWENLEININTGYVAKISYGVEGRNAGVGEGKDYSYLPTDVEALDFSASPKYEIIGDLTPDMRGLLSEAMDRAEDEKSRKAYEKTIELYDKISRVVERDNSKEELDTKKKNEDKASSKTGDLTEEELQQMPIEDLENMLKSTENDNEKKRKELEDIKKKQLILQIKEEIAEGKELDNEIAKAKMNSLEK